MSLSQSPVCSPQTCVRSCPPQVPGPNKRSTTGRMRGDSLCAGGSLLPAEDNRYFSLLISQGTRIPYGTPSRQADVGHGAGFNRTCQRAGVESETTGVGNCSYAQAGPHPKPPQGAGGCLRRCEGTVPGALLAENPLLERPSCTGHQEADKAVYFPTSDEKRRMHSAEKTQPFPR